MPDPLRLDQYPVLLVPCSACSLLGEGQNPVLSLQTPL